MCRLALLSIATCLFATAAAADSGENCAARWWSDQNRAMTYADFMNLCVTDNYQVNGTDYRVNAAWGVTAPPANATGKCNDGTWTTNRWRQDACLSNGGVDVWLQRQWP